MGIVRYTHWNGKSYLADNDIDMQLVKILLAGGREKEIDPVHTNYEHWRKVEEDEREEKLRTDQAMYDKIYRDNLKNAAVRDKEIYDIDKKSKDMAQGINEAYSEEDLTEGVAFNDGSIQEPTEEEVKETAEKKVKEVKDLQEAMPQANDEEERTPEQREEDDKKNREEKENTPLHDPVQGMHPADVPKETEAPQETAPEEEKKEEEETLEIIKDIENGNALITIITQHDKPDFIEAAEHLGIDLEESETKKSIYTKLKDAILSE